MSLLGKQNCYTKIYKYLNRLENESEEDYIKRNEESHLANINKKLNIIIDFFTSNHINSYHYYRNLMGSDESMPSGSSYLQRLDSLVEDEEYCIDNISHFARDLEKQYI